MDSRGELFRHKRTPPSIPGGVLCNRSTVEILQMKVLLADSQLDSECGGVDAVSGLDLNGSWETGVAEGWRC